VSPSPENSFSPKYWEYNAWPTTWTVDNFIAKLRAKVELNPTNPDFTLTVRVVGYKLQMGGQTTKINRGGLAAARKSDS
jgi:hypothetical protein